MISVQEKEELAAVLDRIDVRYNVSAICMLNNRNEFNKINCSFSITAGTYSGVITTKIMADLINSRGVQEDDIITIIGGTTTTKEEAAIALRLRGIKPGEIKSMTIESVILDDKVIAERG